MGFARVQGSSPRMRGAQRRHSESFPSARIIPANAGSTLLSGGGQRVHADHPRECGEHNVGDGHNARFRGSSPRMRGARDASHERDRPDGIIPANAGSTARSFGQTWPHKDHPRECGEHTAPDRFCHCCKGSSPRMRGAPDPLHQSPGIPRIIPANAGSTHTPRGSSSA